MIQKLKSAGIAAIIGAAALASQAQTNAVQTMTFALTAFYQGAPVTNVNHHITNVTQNASSRSVSTKDIISVFGKATTNVFSSAAQLLLVTPIIDGANGPASVIVRDKSAKATNIVDVTAFFSSSSVGPTVRNSTSTNGVLVSETAYAIKTLSVVDAPGYPVLDGHLSLEGFVVENLVREVFKHGLIAFGKGSTWTVNGIGNKGGNPFVVEGNSTITISNPKFIVGPGYSP